MANFQLKSFLSALVIALLLYWNFFLIQSFFSLQKGKNEFQNSAEVLQLLSKNILKISEGSSIEEIRSKQEELKEKIYQNFRVQYGNGEIISFFAQLATSFKLQEARPAIVASFPLQKEETPVDAGSTIHKNQWEYVDVLFNFKARYHDAAKIINLMERSNYILQIRKISLARSNQDAKGPLQNSVSCRFLRLALY